MHGKLSPSQGRLLISEPSLRDFYFGKSVVLLIEHSAQDGTFGLIVNKPINVKLNEVAKEFPQTDFPVFLGGPVNPDRLFYLHTLGEELPGSIPVFGNVYWGGDIRKLMDMIDMKLATPEQVRFFIGYSGWEAGQLDREMGEKSWIVTQATDKIVLAQDPDTLWGNTLKKLGYDYAIWANFPSDPILN
ncbi:MAG: YqgE/AlgH family protein [Bacteroidales bacterium]